ncbi:helix-turn-helix domain-containing protein [Paenibacillus alkaliterrae]|uniref:helix-turn-helix domain-containing protein n=1 Tax=Paenibacillus alkaliterrae TaxID=320909 RepID=UPI001F31BA4E|nr:helix-turn-helix domain-containing protein [Paenibacillus alkaliterrae]MCF2940472.1 helix-turn-helix domain-containing protein [Paenibacillus alkaliterrae]
MGNISESMLQQNSYVAKVIKDQVYNLGNQLLNDKEIVAAMLDKQRDLVKEYHAVNALRSIQINYPFIQMIGIYNGSTEQYINTTGVSFEQERVSLSLIKESRKAYFNFTPRQVIDPVQGGRTANVLTFILLPSYYSQLPPGGIIVINIDESYVQKLIGGYKNYSTNSLYVMDFDGNVVTHSNSEEFMKNLSSESYAQRILSEDKDAGYFNIEIEKQKNLVSYVKSPEMNWVFVNVSKYDNLLFNMNTLKWSTLVIALIMFALSMIVSVWLTNRTYNPIRNLMDKIFGQFAAEQNNLKINEFDLLDTKFSDIIEQLSAMESAMPAAQRAELLKYFKGSQLDLSNKFAQDWEGPYFSVIVITIDSFEQFRRAHSVKAQSLTHFAICNMAEELLSKLFKMNLLIIEEGEIGVLVQHSQDNYPPDLVELLQELQSKMLSYFKLSLTAGIGPAVDSVYHIKESYSIAKESVRGRFFEGKGKIFESSHIVNDLSDEDREYPVKQEKKMVDAIRMNGKHRAVSEVDHFIKELYQCDYQQALFFLNQLVTSLYKQFNTGMRKDDAGSDLLLNLFRTLPTYETLAEINEELINIVNHLCDQLKETSNHQNIEVVEDIRKYIKENYAKPDLSLEWMAGEVKLSRGYLGKLFKAQIGVSFNDYLNTVRMEQAKLLLLETDESVQVISEKIGIYNNTYFYTLFKKSYHVSPAQYRIQMSKKLKNSIK